MIEQLGIILAALGTLGVGGGIRWIYGEYVRNRDEALSEAEKRGRETARAEAYREKSAETIAQKNLELAAKTTVNAELTSKVAQLLVSEEAGRKQIATLTEVVREQQATITELTGRVLP